MPTESELPEYRFVIAHKHPSSGRLLFLQFSSGQICGPQTIPKLAALCSTANKRLHTHPNSVLNDFCELTDFPREQIIYQPEFKLFLEVPNQYASEGKLPVYLGVCSTREPPDLPSGCRWLEMPDSFALSYLQREILREAYRNLMY